MNNKEAALELVKELARVLWLALVAAFLGWAYTKVNKSFDPTTTQYMVAVAALKALDKFVNKNKNIPISSLSPTDYIANKLAE